MECQILHFKLPTRMLFKTFTKKFTWFALLPDIVLARKKAHLDLSTDRVFFVCFSEPGKWHACYRMMHKGRRRSFWLWDKQIWEIFTIISALWHLVTIKLEQQINSINSIYFIHRKEFASKLNYIQFHNNIKITSAAKLFLP